MALIYESKRMTLIKINLTQGTAKQPWHLGVILVYSSSMSIYQIQKGFT